MNRRNLWILLLIGLLSQTSVQAYHQPSVNLGFTSFLDGVSPAGEGWYFQQYVQYWNAGRFNDPLGGGPETKTRELNALISLSQLVYQSNRPMLGGTMGVDFIVPYAILNYSERGDSWNENGFGDAVIGPFVQWETRLGKNGPVLLHRAEMQLIFPTGKYTEYSPVNPGSNHFSFNPYWSGTLLLGEKWSISTRLHYLYNERNQIPDYRPGSAVHGNFAFSYEAKPDKVRIGLNGYFFEQISDTTVEGVKRGDLDERIFGIGPGMMISYSEDNHLMMNLYGELGAKSRPQGFRANMRWVHHF